MRKYRNSVISMLTAGALAGMMSLTGCGGQSSDGDGQGSAESTGTETSADSASASASSARTLSGDLSYRIGFINLDNSDPQHLSGHGFVSGVCGK